MNGLLLAVGTLTAFPVPAPARVDRRVAAQAMALAPVAGLLPAAGAALVYALALQVGWAAPLAAALALATSALATRGLHLDGLADTADALTASYDRARALEVMRRGDTGPAGAACLVLVLLVQVLAAAQAGQAWSLLVAGLAARAVLPVACCRAVPAARPEGLGAFVAATVPIPVAVAVVLATGAGACGLAAVLAGWTAAAWAAASSLAALGAGLVVLVKCVRRFGGITGDVLGACVEIASAAAVLVLALAPAA